MAHERTCGIPEQGVLNRCCAAFHLKADGEKYEFVLKKKDQLWSMWRD